MTVGQYLTVWVEGKQSLRPSTRLSYRTHIRLHLIPHVGELLLGELRPDHVEQMYRSMSEESEPRLGLATMARVHATLTSAMGTAIRRGLIVRNPAETVELPTPVRRRLVVWSGEELAGFLGGIVDDDLYPLYLLLGLCGRRRGEAVGIRWQDVDLDAGLLRVSQQLVVVGRDVVVGEPKSKAGHRVIALDHATVRLLQGHRVQQQQRWRDRVGVDWVDTGLVFTEPTGMALDPAYVSRHFDRLVARSGLPRIRLHDLRHSSASLGLASGESLLEVSRRLGHSSLVVTADIYSHVSPQVAHESAERLSRHVFQH